MPRLMYPGLKLFSRKDDTSVINDKSKAEFEVHNNPSRKYSTKSNENSIRYFNSQINSWGNTPGALNDYSPTIVGTSTFDDSESDIRLLSQFWFTIIQKVFSHVPLRCDNAFIEELHFNIITLSDLNGLNRYVSPLKPQKSILDFPKHQQNWKNDLNYKTKQTSFGLVIRRDSPTFLVQNTLSYNYTVRNCLKIMYKLKGLRIEGRHQSKRIVIMVLIFLYLTFKQTQFRNQYLRYDYMKKLTSLLRSFNSWDALINQYHLQFKELHIESIFDNKTDQVETPYVLNVNQRKHTIQNLHEIISLNVDHLHYALIALIKSRLPYCNESALEEYCKLFDITIFDLEYSFEQKMTDISKKIKGVHTLRKFWLCCILAATRIKVEHGDITGNMGSSLFSNLSQLLYMEIDHETSDSFNSLAFQEQSNEIENVSHAVTSLISLLLRNKDLLHDITSERGVLMGRRNSANSHSKRQLFLISQSIDQLSQQVSELTTNYSKSEDNSLDSHVRDIISKMSSVKNSLEMKLQTKCIEEYKSAPSIRSTRRDISSSIHPKGFALDILRTPTLQSPTIDLKQDIEFTQVDNEDDYSSSDDKSYDNDTTFHLEQFIAATPNQRTVSVHYQSMKQLSDEQLQSQLTNQIMRFSAENKQSRENLRAEKSFELLKRCRKQKTKLMVNDIVNEGGLNDIAEDDYESANRTNDTQQTGGISNYGAEDGIPVLYNIEQFV